MSLVEDLEKVIEGPGTKADRARALYRLGCERTDVVELLGMSYSQAHSIWKELISGKATRTTIKAAGEAQGKKSGRRSNLQASGEEADFQTTAQGGSRRPLHLSPTQTRVATQDGHKVIRIDTLEGSVCRLPCGRSLVYSLTWLAFVHKDSKKDPTDLEDYYND